MRRLSARTASMCNDGIGHHYEGIPVRYGAHGLLPHEGLGRPAACK